MHECSKRCQSHNMFGKNSVVNDILCFQTKFKCSPASKSAIKLPIQPSQLIKRNAHNCPIPGASAVHTQTQQQSFLFNPQNSSRKNAHKCPIPGASHLHEKTFQPQITSLGISQTHVTTRKACQNYVHHGSHSIPYAWMCKLMP